MPESSMRTAARRIDWRKAIRPGASLAAAGLTFAVGAIVVPVVTTLFVAGVGFDDGSSQRAESVIDWLSTLGPAGARAVSVVVVLAAIVAWENSLGARYWSKAIPSAKARGPHRGK
jgi:hypothetical protein